MGGLERDRRVCCAGSGDLVLPVGGCLNMFRREARWMMIAMPILAGVALLAALTFPRILSWLGLVQEPTPIKWNEDAGTHME